MTEFNLIPPPVQRRDQKQASLSASQEGLWFLHQLAPQSPAYNVIYLFRMLGGVDLQILEQSLNKLFLLHEILRTVYKFSDEKPIQVVQPYKPFKISYLDYSFLMTDEKKQILIEYAKEHGSEPFDLENGPVFRSALLHVGEKEDYLFFAIHHIASDDWSRSVFLQDLIQLYGTYRSGKEPNLSPLPIQYTDYAIWQKEWISGETRKKFVQHWKGILDGDLPILTFPYDHPLQMKKSDRVERHLIELNQSFSPRIREFCREEHLTPAHLLMAVYAVLLMRYSGQEDIIIGCPFANRPRSELGGLMGCFINTLPIRINLGGNPIIRDLLRQVRKVMLDAYTWQALPFETVVTELAPQRDQSHMPIYQTIINILNVPKRQNSILGLEIDVFFREQALADYDLTMEFSDVGDHINPSIIYNADLFDISTILRMASHYQNLLTEMLIEPDNALSEIEMLSSNERQQILVEWNNTFEDYPHEKCVHQLFEAQVERTPDSPAVLFGEQQLTYRELNEGANQIAHYLRKLGAGPDLPIGLYVKRSTELVVAILGILKSGSPYVPLDTLYPVERQNEIIRDSGLKIMVTQDSLVSNEYDSYITLLRLDEQHELLDTENTQNPVQVVKPENLAYIIYTSGSTGKPKGVEITHRSLVNSLLSTSQRAGLSSSDLSLMVTTPIFDQSIFDLLAPLYIGATVALASLEEVYDTSLFIKRVMELPLTWMDGTPATWQMLRDAGWHGKPGLKILIGGEPFSPDLANWLMKSCGEVYNLYGPTEATIQCTSVRLTPEHPITIGRPIANTSLYILDSHLRLVPVGVKGELYIGGEGLARGYHNRPELTAEKFIPDLFSNAPRMRLYATGDLARYRLNGEIDLLGRIDNQVKIRGYRIELGEIETVISQYPGILQTLVMVREDLPGDKRLVAYIIPNPVRSNLLASEVILDLEKLRGFLAKKLPPYMLPSTFVQMDAFPLTVNGKIDRKGLPIPDKNNQTTKNKYLLPRDNLERQLAQIWEQLLNIKPIGIEDDFFELGGHSLLAVQLFSQIEKIIGRQLPLATLFQSPTISGLAANIRDGNLTQTWSSIVPIKPDGSKPPFFMVHGIGGNILNYHGITEYLDLEQPFYGLQSKGLDGKSSPLYTVEEMATHYINEIRAFLPEGPYLIGGHSFGGWIAIEMANQLHHQGRNAALVILLDTGANTLEFMKWSERVLYKTKSLIERTVNVVQNIVFSSKKDRLEYVKKLNMRYKRRQDVQKWAMHIPDLEIDELQVPKYLKNIRQINYAAAYKYTHNKYCGKVTLLKAEKRGVGEYDKEFLGWKHFAEEVDIHVIPGNHISIIEEPNVQVLARVLQNCIDQAIAEE